MRIQVKRVYEPTAKSDGFRVLVDRLWPRGLSKSDAKLDLWLPEDTSLQGTPDRSAQDVRHSLALTCKARGEIQMIRPLVRIAAAAMCGVIVQVATPASGAWERFHGDAANRGFADVDTKPAAGGSLSVPGLGTFTPGAGPVIAPDGSVYLGTQEGKVIALHADGKPFWSRDINKDESIVASPAVGADGSVYVIGAKSKITKIKLGTLGAKKTEIASILYAFNATGALLARTPFPTRTGLRGATTAPPNIVSVGGKEVILTPAIYRQPHGVEMRLIGFVPTGGVVLDQLVTLEFGTPTGGGEFTGIGLDDALCLIPPLGFVYCAICGFGQCDYNPSVAPRVPPPMPGVGVFTFAGGGAPHVIVSNQLHSIKGFTATSALGLTDTFQIRDGGRSLFSAPMVLPNGHTLVSTGNREIVFAEPNANKLSSVRSPGLVYGPATLTVNGFAVVVGELGLAVLNNSSVVSQVSLPPSHTSAAASRTHVFVSTTDAFITLDADAQLELQKFDWVGGGKSPPAIGPDGRVYAIASDILFIFPPPLKVSKPLPHSTGAVLQKDPGGQ